MLNELCEGGFRHYEQSVRVVELLEKDGKGLNLTYEVRDGILKHQMWTKADTMEGQVVRMADKIAYINHDVDDAINAGILTEQMLPEGARRVLGGSVRERLNTVIHSIISASLEQGDVVMAPECEEAVMSLREFMFEHVYANSKPKEEEAKAQLLLKGLYDYYMANTEQLPPEYIEGVWTRRESFSRAVCDYIAGMTDEYAIAKYEELFVPKGWQH